MCFACQMPGCLAWLVLRLTSSSSSPVSAWMERLLAPTAMTAINSKIILILVETFSHRMDISIYWTWLLC